MLTVKRDWALFEVGRVQDPGVDVRAVNGRADKADEHCWHSVGSFFVVHVPQVEWQSSTGMQLSPSTLYPSGHSVTHLTNVGCL